MTPPPDAHVITEFVVPAAPFAWSMLLICVERAQALDGGVDQHRISSGQW